MSREYGISDYALLLLKVNVRDYVLEVIFARSYVVRG